MDAPDSRPPDEVVAPISLDQLLPLANDELRAAAGDAAAAILLYGSAAGGGFKPGKSNVNLLVVLKTLDVAAMRKLTPVVAAWAERTFTIHVTTVEELRASARIFPIHLLELQEHHRVLSGDDPTTGIDVTRADLLASSERELREIARGMRRAVLLHGEERRALGGAVRRSFRALVYALRGVLRYLGKLPPTTDKHPTLEAAATALDLPHARLLELLAFRRRIAPVTPSKVDELAESLLEITTKAAQKVAAMREGA